MQFSEDACTAANCCWQPVRNGAGTPWCYHQAGEIKSCTLKSEPKVPFSAADMSTIQSLFEANLDIQGSGMVVAAPDHNTGPGGDYYYAWMRDGALSMGALLETAQEVSSVEEKMDHWVDWVQRSYQQVDPNGDIVTEPKFNIPDGTPFSGGWCRPQNDGPGLRAITLMAYSAKKPSLSARAWSLVRQELDWVVANYTSQGCDLWEEVRSTDFFWNRYTMRKALIQGSAFAKSVGGDDERSSTYMNSAQEITQLLAKHISPDGFVFEAENRQLDTAVVEAFNVGDMSDGIFAPLDRAVIMTLNVLSHYFCNAYGVNQNAAQSNVPGILFGRYQGDTYAGGNPWILLTASVATLLYRQSEAMSTGEIISDPEAAEVLGKLLGQEVSATALLGAGDSILNLVKTFLTNGMHMNEQIDRDSGILLSAKDLTWNYANVLKAMQSRSAAVDAMQSSISV